MVIGLLPIVNPVTAAPLFVALSKSFSDEERNALARLTCLYATAILMTFLVSGALVLSFLGITIDGVRVAGGIVIGAIGFRMLFASSEDADAEGHRGRSPSSIAMTPLAMPMLSGPGSIAIILSISSDIAEQETLVALLVGYLAAAAGIVIVVIICWLVLRGSGRIVSALGSSGIDAVTGILGFLLVAMAVNFVESGITGFITAS